MFLIPAALFTLQMSQAITETGPSQPNNGLLQISFDQMVARDSLVNDSGERLEQLLSNASRDYLELKNESAFTLTERALDLIGKSLPYRQLSNDLVEIYSLKMVIAAELEDPKRFPTTSYLQRQQAFLDKLPLRLQEQVRSAPLPQKVSLSDWIKSQRIIRLWIMGEEQRRPLNLLVAGKHLAHWMSSDGTLYGGWIIASKEKGIETQILGKQSVLKLIPRTQTITQPTPFASTKFDAMNPEPWKEEQDIERSSLWKSPWFWAVTGAVAAGVGGYFIYQSQNKKVIRTP